MNVTEAKYIKDPLTNKNASIDATIDGVVMSVPISEGNRHYKEIQRLAHTGQLKIKEADD